jgi:hypothetical protein
MALPTVAPLEGGHVVELLVHELTGAQDTVPAVDVKVRLVVDAGNPGPVCSNSVAILPTVIEQE